MDRRDFLSAIASGVLAGPRAASAQARAAPPRIGVLGLTPWPASLSDALVQGLSELGYTIGRDATLHIRDADGKPDRMPQLAAELVALKVDLLLARGAGALVAEKDVAGHIPIVAVDLESDPVARGFVRTLAQPGGNVTGVFLDVPELSGKQLQLLKEVIPSITRVAVFGDPALNATQFQAAAAAAQILGLQTQRLEVKAAREIDAAFEAASQAHAHAILLLSSPLVFHHRRDLGVRAARRRLPALSMFVEFAEAGGLMAYGPSLREAFRRAGRFVARILKGASPGSLPVERPETFELVINRTTAKGLGLTIPPSLLRRADRVLE